MKRPSADAMIGYLRACPQAVAAWAVGLSPRSFRDRHVPRSGDGSYNLRSVVGALLQERVDDELTASGSATDSPNLERMRLARARAAEADLLERLKELIPAVEVAALLSEVCGGAKLFAQRQAELYGPAALDDWSEVVEQIERSVNRRLRLPARRRELTVYEDGESPITIDLSELAPLLSDEETE